MPRSVTPHRLANSGLIAVFVPTAALLAAGCAASAPSASRQDGAPVDSASPVGSCLPRGLSGTFERTLTPEEAPGFDLAGTWRLELADCSYEVTLDDERQGGGRVELTEGDARSGQLALSDDTGCPNDFIGTGLYAFTAADDTLSIEEEHTGLDGCEGRAEVLVGEPAWERQ